MLRPWIVIQLAPPSAARRHDLAGLPGAEDHAEKVHVDDLPYHLNGSVGEIADVSGDASIVHYTGHHAQLAGCDGEQSFHVVLAGDIYLGQDALRSGGLRLGGGLVGGSVVFPVGEGEIMAGLGQLDSGCRPDTAAAPSDDGDGPIAIIHFAAAPSVSCSW